MTSALRVFSRALGDAWDALVLLAALNLLWLALSLLIVFLPPATAAMFAATHELAGGRAPSVRDFLTAVRSHFWQAWRWALVNVAAAVVFAAIFAFYGSIREPWADAVEAVSLLFVLFWCVSQLFVWPFLLSQAEPRLSSALRNAVLAVLAAPLFAFTFAAIVAIVLALSLALIAPIAVITTAFLCLLANHAVTDRLRAFGKLPAEVRAAPGNDG